MSLLGQQEATGLPDDKEHFGFRDGISQPWIEGTETVPPTQRYGGGKRTSKEEFDALKPGEFILGHVDELNRIPQPLVPPELSKNGTYLVLRKLQQHVATFRQAIKAQAKYVFGNHEGKGLDKKEREEKERKDEDRLAALMLGRWPSGCPVTLSPDQDNQSIADDLQQINAFDYDDDANGEQCPVGAHIRRTNPRDWHQGNSDKPVVEPISTRHRMIRRSLPYGPELPKKQHEDDQQERGLMFIALVADIARQFEFVQRHWINDGDFFQLDKDERDPLMGNNCDRRDVSTSDSSQATHSRKFTVPAATKLPWALNLPEFVTTKGGEYFFLPSKTALQQLATGKFSSFLKTFEQTETSITDPRRRALAQRGLIQEGLNERPHETLHELLQEAENGRFKAMGYPGVMMPTVIVTKYQDVCEVLKHPDMTVELYSQKMEVKKEKGSPRPPRGPFILGRNPTDDDGFYNKEQPLIGEAIIDLMPRFDLLLPTILNEVFADIAKKPPTRVKEEKKTVHIDVIEDLAWRVPIDLAHQFFGVPGPDQATLKEWLRCIYKDTFHNTQKDPECQRNADMAVAGMSSYLDGLIQQLALSGGPPDSVLKALIAIQKSTPDLAPDFAMRNIMGLLVGLVDPTLKTIARTIDQLIRRPKELQEVHDAAKEEERGRDRVLNYVLEAMRFNPMSHVLYRKCRKDMTIADGTPRKMTIKEGTMVFASTLTAMFDKEGPFREDPTSFRSDRKRGDYLFFGHSVHECMGQHLITIVIHEVFMRLLAFKNLRRANDDLFNPFDHVPEHLYLEFDL